MANIAHTILAVVAFITFLLLMGIFCLVSYFALNHFHATHQHPPNTHNTTNNDDDDDDRPEAPLPENHPDPDTYDADDEATAHSSSDTGSTPRPPPLVHLHPTTPSRNPSSLDLGGSTNGGTNPNPSTTSLFNMVCPPILRPNPENPPDQPKPRPRLPPPAPTPEPLPRKPKPRPVLKSGLAHPGSRSLPTPLPPQLAPGLVPASTSPRPVDGCVDGARGIWVGIRRLRKLRGKGGKTGVG